MPVPEPTPVASKVTPTVLLVAPIAVKFVVPTVRIVYSSPTVKDPAFSTTLEGLFAAS